MLIYSDNKDLAHNFLGNNIESPKELNPTPLEVKSLSDSLIPAKNIYRFEGICGVLLVCAWVGGGGSFLVFWPPDFGRYFEKGLF